MYKEIGSEFWETSQKKNEKKFFILGRAALDYIIQDILYNANIDSVVLPSFCCNTMIEPFLKNNIKVRFYQVYYDKNKGLSICMPKVCKNEIFYMMRYFGFNKINNLDEKAISRKWDVVLEDKTHSWLQDRIDCSADYIYASCRKWDGFEGLAYAEKINKRFNANRNYVVNEQFIKKRSKAMLEKMKFINNQINVKDNYMKLFAQSNDYIKNYNSSAPNVEIMEKYINLDSDYIKVKRRENANYLIKGLKKIKGISLIFEKMELGDIPLFVPILVESRYRDKLRRYLIDNQIYCPIHWPMCDLHSDVSEQTRRLYKEEISIICDQRYNIDDMKRILKVIEEFYMNV